MTCLLLVLVGEGAGKDDVIERYVRRKAEALCDGSDALGAERALGDALSRNLNAPTLYLGVDVCDLAVRASLISRKLRSNAQCVTCGESGLVTLQNGQSWVFPVRNSPKTSVMDIVSIPPPRSSSQALAPVVSLITCLRRLATSEPEINEVAYDDQWNQERSAHHELASCLKDLVYLCLSNSLNVAEVLDRHLSKDRFLLDLIPSLCAL